MANVKKGQLVPSPQWWKHWDVYVIPFNFLGEDATIPSLDPKKLV